MQKRKKSPVNRRSFLKGAAAGAAAFVAQPAIRFHLVGCCGRAACRVTDTFAAVVPRQLAGLDQPSDVFLKSQYSNLIRYERIFQSGSSAAPPFRSFPQPVATGGGQLAMAWVGGKEYVVLGRRLEGTNTVLEHAPNSLATILG